MSEKDSFEKIVQIMKILRSENGCPWDRSRNLSNLRENIIEEAYELVDAITRNDMENIQEEVGDLLLQSVFVSQIMEEKGVFDIYEALNSLSKKLTERHPHVFGDKKAKTPEEAKASWDSVKNRGKTEIDLEKYKKFPALIEARKISSKAAKYNFDWEKAEDIFEKIEEEIGEIREAVKEKNKEKIEEEIGDLLFTIVNLARKLNIDSEIALKKANEKFRKRFSEVLKKIKETPNLTLEELNMEWEKVKKREES